MTISEIRAYPSLPEPTRVNLNNRTSNQNTVSFGNQEDKVEISGKQPLKEASTSKKWGVGIASACITGLGQLINGEVGKGFAFFGGSIVAGTTTYFISKANKTLGHICAVCSLAIPIASIVDAVKNAKPSKE